MTLITYNPKSAINEFDRLFDRLWGFEYNLPRAKKSDLRFRVNEDKNSYFIETDLPGVEKKDIDINISDDIITVSGERKISKNQDENLVQCGDSNYGHFKEEFYLPEDVNIDKINAEMKNGVLSIEIKKSKKVPSNERKITIK